MTRAVDAATTPVPNPTLRHWLWVNFGWDIAGVDWAEDDIWF